MVTENTTTQNTGYKKKTNRNNKNVRLILFNSIHSVVLMTPLARTIELIDGTEKCVIIIVKQKTRRCRLNSVNLIQFSDPSTGYNLISALDV